MGRGMLASLGLGLLFLALLLPTQIYSDNTIIMLQSSNFSKYTQNHKTTTREVEVPCSAQPVFLWYRSPFYISTIYSDNAIIMLQSSNSSKYTSVATQSSNTTTQGSGGPLQCTACLLVVSFSLLHLDC
ncbi:PREDICTED: signal transducer CD24-like [Elephantulus edwardii]|uniref:signal transducer CD24-like n=1 Tax=Elephantulus edwardii TaxID=28737 RepID=UPI0003F078BF|nr:PREDICTED: signal transducer CD24-like [Elephantulus edwardii]